jgi:hypothetical protein
MVKNTPPQPDGSQQPAVSRFDYLLGFPLESGE